MPSTKDFTNVDVSKYDIIPIDDRISSFTQLNVSNNIILEPPMIDEEESDDDEFVSQQYSYLQDRTFLERFLPIESDDDEFVSQRDLYLLRRPFLERLLPSQYLSMVERDMDLYTILQTHDFYTNHWDSWCQIQACLFEWAGEECGPFRHELIVSEELVNYVARNYRDFERYLNYVRRNEESLRWGTN